jgi:hypothetical protein
MDVIVTVFAEEAQTMDLDTMLAEDDGLREDEAEIRATLARGEVYHGGGGAAPAFAIKVGTPREHLDAEARAFMDRRLDLAVRSLDEWLIEHRAHLTVAERKEGAALLARFSEYGGEDI